MSNIDHQLEENRPPQRRETATGAPHASADVAPERQAIQSIQAIVTEGDDERWQLARRTARAVFREPALVTPRHIALLGEEGLAAFVDEVRALARGFILRERRRQARSSAADAGFEDAGTQGTAADEPRQQRQLRRPALLGLVQHEAPSMTELLRRRLPSKKAAKAFTSDAVFASMIAAVALVLALFVLRVALRLS